MDNAVVYDFETLSQDAVNGVVISFAMLSFDESRFITKPYEYEELLKNCHMIKFNVDEQVKEYGRSVQKDTIEWWKNQPKEAQLQLKPSEDDVSIVELYDFFVEHQPSDLKKLYTRGNTFDPVFFDYIMRDTDNITPYPWWIVRDTRSLIDGMAWGTDLNNKFMPPTVGDKFIHHDPKHDIAVDVMRIQTVAQSL